MEDDYHRRKRRKFQHDRQTDASVVKSSQDRFAELLKDADSFDDNELQKLVSKDPTLCMIRYTWCHRWQDGSENVSVYPIWRICEFRRVSLELTRMIYEAYPQAIRMPEDEYGQVPLHLACYFKTSIKVVQFLVQTWREGLLAKDRENMLPLHWACYSPASINVIEYLLEEYPEGITKMSKEVWLPLHWACSRKPSYPIIRLLVSKFKKGLEKTTENGLLPLHLACMNHASLKVIRCLVSGYPDALRKTDDDGCLPLHRACINKASLDVIQHLVAEYPQGLKQKANGTGIPLHWACYKIQTAQVIQFLVSKYPNGLEEKDEDDRLPLHYACHSGAPFDVIQCLMAEYPKSLKEKDVDGWIPLRSAFQESQISLQAVSKLVSRYPESLKMIEPLEMTTRWQITKEDAKAFVLSTDANNNDSLLAIWCGDGDDVTRITRAPTKGILVAGKSMHSKMVQPIAKALQVNETLLCLGFANNPIGDAGAKMLATALTTNKVLHTVDVQNCGIGVAGLSSLLEALQRNKTLTDLDLSDNTNIFNNRGGEIIAGQLSTISSLKRLYLFHNNHGFSETFVSFLGELMHLLHWNPTSFSPILLNVLYPQMVEAVYYYQQDLHELVLRSDSMMRSMLLHYILESSGIQSNSDLIFFHVKNFLVH